MSRVLERVIPVEIVRPHRSPAERLLAAVLVVAVRTWVVMLGVGAFFPEVGLGFWQVLLALAVTDMAGLTHRPNFTEWTRERRSLR